MQNHLPWKIGPALAARYPGLDFTHPAIKPRSAEHDTILSQLRLFRYTDESFKELTEALSLRRRKTLLVGLSDHLPTFPESIRGLLWADDKNRPPPTLCCGPTTT